MTPSILLLDCDPKLEEKLRLQGFDVESGTVGFTTGRQKLPCQLYEKDIIIYNPKTIAKTPHDLDMRFGSMQVETPEFSIHDSVSFLKNGGTILAFVNKISTNQASIREAYSWIPSIPPIDPTKDRDITAVNIHSPTAIYKWIMPIVSSKYPKIPVTNKLIFLADTQGQALYFNRNGDILGAAYVFGPGKVILLPESDVEEQIVMNFLHRVIPKLYSYTSGQQLIDKFRSSKEKDISDELEKTEEKIVTIENERDTLKANLAEANREKVTTIKQDETANQILDYFDMAVQQDDVALFYLYKVTEALQKKYGGEKQAKDALNTHTEWNLIGRLSNASYADIRHAPSPGEKKKEWSEEEIKSCFEAAEKIIHQYLSSLF